MMNRNNIMITNAYQKGNTVYIYNERGAQSASIMVAPSKQSGLRGFTGQTVSIQQGNSICTYNEKGYEVGSPIYAGKSDNKSSSTSSQPAGGFISRVKSVIIIAVIFAIIYHFFY